VAESSWPSPSNGRVIDDTQYEKLAVSYGPSAGVVGDFTSPQLVYGDSTGMQIKIAADRYALVRGHAWWSGSSIFTKAISANASGSTRTDLVVLRLSRTTWDVTVVVVAGTPGSGAPAPTQNLGTTGSYDLPLATVTVASGAATISAANVTYVATHLSGDGGGYLVPSVAALAYVPSPFAGQRAALSDGNTYTYNGTAWRAAMYARKLASEGVASNTTPQNDDDLFAAVAANAVYEVRMMLRIASQFADDFKFTFTGPTGYTFDYIASGILPAGTSFGDDQTAVFNQSSTPGFGGLAGTTAPLYITGLLVIGSTAGTFRLQWSQANSAATVTSLLSNSFMVLDRLA
jgi:hypothetical protein